MRFVVFTDINTEVTYRLVAATIRAARARGDMTFAAAVVTRPDRYARRHSRLRRAAHEAMVTMSNRDQHLRDAWVRAGDVAQLLHRHDVPVVSPEAGDPNTPAFRARLRDEYHCDVALSFYCLRIFRQPLLDDFEQAVNFHNALLPAYKGRMATAMALYHGEPRVGYTFHRMAEAVDAGDVLVQGSLAVDDRVPLATVTSRMSRQASADVPKVLDLIAGRAPGQPQTGEGSSFSQRDAHALLRIDDPTTLAADELHRRARAFGTLELRIDGHSYAVTRFRTSAPGRALAFRTADGVVLAPDRLGGVPAWRRHLRGP